MQKIHYETPEEFLTDPFFKRGTSTGFLRLDISRNALMAVLASILLHAILLIVAWPILDQAQSESIKNTALQITLASPKTAEVIAPQPIIEPEVKPKTTVLTQKEPVKKPVIPTKSVFSVPKELAKIEQNPVENSVIVKPSLAEKPLPVEVTKEEFPDMDAMLKAKRAARAAAGDAAAINAAEIAKAALPSPEEQRMARIKQNMKQGTNGIFDITSLTSRNATFAFRGWTGDYSNARLEFFEVEVKSGQDIRLATIRRMIALIREHYEGDFNWESHRLNQVVPLSARLEDSAGLEDFMLKEFFGANYKNQ